MTDPTGRGPSGGSLEALGRAYLEAYAKREGDVRGQILLGADGAAGVLSILARTLGGAPACGDLVDERIGRLEQGRRGARSFEDRLANASCAIYNSLDALGRLYAEGNEPAADLIRNAGSQARAGGTAAARSAAAMRAAFALLGLVTIAADDRQSMTGTIRKLERRFADADLACASDWDHLLNALYRSVEMMQLFALVTGPELAGRIAPVAARFQQEDGQGAILLKMRNGFCRLFELGHLLAAHADASV